MGKYISSSESVIGISNIRNLLSVPNLLRRLYPDQDLVTSAPDLGVSEGNQGPVGPGDLGGTDIVLILGKGTVPILPRTIFRELSVQKKEEVSQSRRDRFSRGSRKYMRQPPVPVSWYLRVTPHQTHGRMSLLKNEPVKG